MPKNHVDMNVVNEAILTTYCEKYGVVTEGTLAERVAALAAKVKASVPKKQIAACDRCNGDSNVEDEVCPYCGEGGVDLPGDKPAAAKPEANPAKAVKVAAKAKASTKATAAQSTTVSIETVKGNGQSGPAVPTDEAMAQAESEPDPLPVPPPMPPSAEPITRPDMKPVAVSIYATTTSSDPHVELVPSGLVQEIDGRSVYDLVEVQAKQIAEKVSIDVAVEAVQEAKKLAVVCYWQLGRAILRCFTDDLWKQRRDARKQPLYKGFSQFVEAELGMAAGYAYKLMNVSATFSATDVAVIGVAKLGIMLRLEPATRTKLLADVRNGVPYSEVAEEVRKLAEGTAPQRGQGKRDLSKATAAATAKKLRAQEKTGEIITATFDAKRIKVPLFARPENDPPAGAKPRRAKKLADDPWGEIVGSNGVTMRMAISMDAEGKLIAIVEYRRDS